MTASLVDAPSAVEAGTAVTVPSGTPERAVRRAQALAFHGALYARLQSAGEVSLWQDQYTPTQWYARDDADGFADAVSEIDSGTVFVPVVLRSSRPVMRCSSGSVANLTEFAEVLFVDFDLATPESGKPAVGDAALGYAATHDDARVLLDQYLAARDLPPHVLVRTPGGYQLYIIVEPIDRPTYADIAARLETDLLAWLAARGVMVDRGVTTTPTRQGRAPGSLHSKPIKGSTTGERTPLRLVELESVSDAPAVSLTHLDAVLPALQPAGSGSLPPAADGEPRICDVVAAGLPVRDLLPLLGWPVREALADQTKVHISDAAQSDINAVVYHAPTAAQERLVVYSATSAEETGLPLGHPQTSYDLIQSLYCGGDYRRAARLCERYVGPGGFDAAGLLAFLATRPDLDQVDAAGLAAASSWPQGLDRQAAGRLVFRGVAPDVATARGYESLDINHLPPEYTDAVNLVHLEWALRAPVHCLDGTTTETVQFRGRPYSDAEIEAATGKKKVGRPTTKIPAATSFGARPQGPWPSLAANPLGLQDVADVSIPLAVAVATDSDRPGEPAGWGQVQADAILSAAREERLPLAVVHAPDWAHLYAAPGSPTNPSRHGRLAACWSRVPLQGRRVYLVSRCSWRRDVGLVATAESLAARGADVRVVNVPRPRRTGPRVATYDHSTWAVDDELATYGSGRLRSLLTSAVDIITAARWSSIPDPESTTQIAETIVQALLDDGGYLYDTTSKQWLVDRGTHMQRGGAGSNPTRRFVQILRDHDTEIDSVKTLQDVVAAVARDARLQVSTADFDADPFVVYAANGVVDLRAGKLRPRERGERNLKFTPVSYDKKARAALWHEFLLTSMCGDQEMVDYLQELAGLTLIGTVLEESATVHVGGGSNGKTTYDETLQHTMGPYATSIPSEWLSQQPNGFQHARLQGARLVVAEEPDRGFQVHSAGLKRFTSRGSIPAEIKGGELFDFRPSHRLEIPSNHYPSLADSTDGAWRRFVIVEWLHQISRDQMDLSLPARLRNEASGVLAWMVRGAMRVMARYDEQLTAGKKFPDGLVPRPERVREAVDATRSANDRVGQFLAQACTLDDAATVPQADLARAFKAWVEESFGDKPWSSQALNRELRTKGFRPGGTAHKPVWVGVRLGAPDDVILDPMATPAAPPMFAAATSNPTTAAADVAEPLGDSDEEVEL